MSRRDKRKKRSVAENTGHATVKTSAIEEPPAVALAAAELGPAQSSKPVAFFVQVYTAPSNDRQRASAMYIAVVETPERAVAAVRAALAGSDVEVTENTFRVGPGTVKAMGLANGQVMLRKGPATAGR